MIEAGKDRFEQVTQPKASVADCARYLREDPEMTAIELSELGLAPEVLLAPERILCRTTRDREVNAMGAYRPDMRELDLEALRRSKVVVETREAALAEAGDLLIPIDEGALSADCIYAELADVARGNLGRENAEEITIFKSVGVAFEDLLVASELLGKDLGDSGSLR